MNSLVQNLYTYKNKGTLYDRIEITKTKKVKMKNTALAKTLQ